MSELLHESRMRHCTARTIRIGSGQISHNQLLGQVAPADLTLYALCHAHV